ncbi:MAG: pyridoxal phosphate-dependent aminotransferase [Lachnospiraceae bacterium]|nr:pyridoxal phosphate-dependent aminotransferase [Lachnospiraceae bacterium]
MINKKYRDMLDNKSVIRELSEFATRRGNEIGYENVFDFSLGNPSVPAPESYKKAAMELLEKMDPMKLHGYTPTNGNDTVKKQLADSLNKRFGMNYKPCHIFPTAGAAGAIAHALRAVTQPGDEVIVFAPFFPEYYPYINETGARIKIVEADTEAFQINFEDLEKKLTDSVAALLINTPNNPSGAVYTEETLTRLSEVLRRKSKEFDKNIFLISDEPYREIVFDGKKAPYVASFYEHTLTCYSFSKSLSIPGERVGYVAVNPACEDADKLVPMFGQISRGIGHNCPSSLVTIAMGETCDDTSDLSVYETNMNLIYDCLKELGFTVTRPGGTFYIMPKALEESSKDFCEKAKKYDLILVPADSFHAPGYFRMAYCIDTEKVKRSLEALRRFVNTEYPDRA